MKYWFVYKCPLCGQLLKFKESVEIPYSELPNLLGKVVQNQQFAGNPYLHKVPMHIVCQCKNGNAGLASFAGFVEDKSCENRDGATTFLNKITGMITKGKDESK